MKSANDANISEIARYRATRLADCRPSYVALAAFVLLWLMVAGCTTAPLRSVTGQDAAAPEGFIYLCRQVPTPPECGGSK